jgi:hypothetical protein
MTVAIILSFFTPVVIGYIYGRNDIDPDTEEGKAYYE